MEDGRTCSGNRGAHSGKTRGPWRRRRKSLTAIWSSKKDPVRGHQGGLPEENVSVRGVRGTRGQSLGERGRVSLSTPITKRTPRQKKKSPQGKKTFPLGSLPPFWVPTRKKNSLSEKRVLQEAQGFWGNSQLTCCRAHQNIKRIEEKRCPGSQILWELLLSHTGGREAGHKKEKRLLGRSLTGLRYEGVRLGTHDCGKAAKNGRDGEPLCSRAGKKG